MLVTQSRPILCDLMDCSPPGSSVHGLVAIPFSRGASRPRAGETSNFFFFKLLGDSLSIFVSYVHRRLLGYLCHTRLLHMPAQLSVCTDAYSVAYSVTCVHRCLLGYLCTHTPAGLPVYTDACWVICVHTRLLGYLCTHTPARLPVSLSKLL